MRATSGLDMDVLRTELWLQHALLAQSDERAVVKQKKRQEDIGGGDRTLDLERVKLTS